MISDNGILKMKSQYNYYMNNETRLYEIEQLVEELNKKLRSQQLWNIRLQQRLLGFEGRLNLKKQPSGSYISGKENFQDLLQKSVVLQEYLKKTDQNSIQNLKIIEEHINTNVQTLHRKCNSIEQKMLNLLWQKEKTFENTAYQIENNTISIKSLEEYVKNIRNQNQALNLYQQNIKMRHNSLLKQIDIRIDSIKDDIAVINNKEEKNEKKYQRLEESVIRITSKVEEKQNQIQNLSQQLQKIKLKQIKNLQDHQKPHEKINEKNTPSKDPEIPKIYKEITTLKERIAILQNQFASFQSNQHSSQHSQVQVRQQFSNQRNSQSILQKPFMKQPLFQKEKLKNEEEIPAMRGGIHGLLRRSKQKEQQKSPMKYPGPSLLNPLKALPKKTNLPPMKSNPILNRQQRQQIYEQQSQSDNVQEMYECDEEGYLMDAQGNYLEDQQGQRIKISEEQLKQLVNQHSRY